MNRDSKFSIATFNLKNLALPNVEYYKNTSYSESQYNEKTTWIRDMIEEMNAGIIGFQEVFQEEALYDLINCEQLKKYKHYAVAKRDQMLPCNGLISRYPIVYSEVFTSLPEPFVFFDEKKDSADQHVHIPITEFSRPVLKCTIQLTQKHYVTVFVAHLKSKRPILEDNRDENDLLTNTHGRIRSLIKRGLESLGLKRIVMNEIDQHPQNPVFVVGDLNDSDTSVTCQAILGEPPVGRGITDDQRRRGWAYKLHSVKDIQARRAIENYYYTYIHDGHYDTLDNIFVSNHFAEQNKERSGRVIYVRLYNDHLIDFTVAEREYRQFEPASDHGLVMAQFEMF